MSTYIIDDSDRRFVRVNCEADIAAEFFGSKALERAQQFVAAPELLEALRECLALVRIKYGNLDADVNAVVGRADLAVSKATTPAQRSESHG